MTNSSCDLVWMPGKRHVNNTSSVCHVYPRLCVLEILVGYCHLYII